MTPFPGRAGVSFKEGPANGLRSLYRTLEIATELSPDLKVRLEASFDDLGDLGAVEGHGREQSLDRLAAIHRCL